MRRNLLNDNYLMLDKYNDILRPVVEGFLPTNLLKSLQVMRDRLKKYESKNNITLKELAIDENNFYDQQLLNFFSRREIDFTIINKDMVVNAYFYSMYTEDRFFNRMLRYMLESEFLENEKDPTKISKEMKNYIRKYGHYSYNNNDLPILRSENKIYLYNAGTIDIVRIDISDELEKLRIHQENSEKLFNDNDMKSLIYANPEQKK